MAAGDIIQGVRWLRDAAGRLVGYRNPITDKDEEYNFAAGQSLVSGAGFRPQIVANNGLMPTARRQGTSGARTDQMMQSRMQHYVGPVDVTNLQFAYAGFLVLNTGAGESLLGNSYTFETSLELITPSLYSTGFKGGAKFGTVESGAPLVLTDPVYGFDMTAGTRFFSRTGTEIASTAEYYPAGFQMIQSAGWLAPTATASVIQAVGAMTVPGGGLTYSAGNQPYAVIGIPATACPAIVFTGDSIGYGSGDNVGDDFGTKGYLGRAANAALAAGPIPWSLQTSPTNALNRQDMQYGLRQRALWQYATHIVNNSATNDISGGATLAAIQALCLALWASQKRVTGPYGVPLKVYHCKVLPRTTGSWETAASQTGYATGFAPGGIRDQFNAWLDTQVGGGLLDGVINPLPVCEDPANPGKWVTNGAANYSTADGIHPYAPMAGLMAAYVAPTFATFTPR